MTKIKEPPTYEGEVLGVLAFEFSFSDQAESERKIKRRIRDKNLGSYDQTRINTLRSFKDDIQQELSKFQRSKFYTQPHGKYADMQDWDLDALKQYMKAIHPDVPEIAINGFLPYAVFLYYLR